MWILKVLDLEGWNIKLDKEDFVDMQVLSPDQCQGHGSNMNFEIIFRTFEKIMAHIT